MNNRDPASLPRTIIAGLAELAGYAPKETAAYLHRKLDTTHHALRRLKAKPEYLSLAFGVWQDLGQPNLNFLHWSGQHHFPELPDPDDYLIPKLISDQERKTESAEDNVVEARVIVPTGERLTPALIIHFGLDRPQALGEELAFLRLISSAIVDFLHGVDAESWIRGARATSGIQFDELCEALNLDSNVMRQKLLAVREFILGS